ncbi:MAG: bacteriohemerythrin, partial [Desulfobulbaceae bacterium]|nr:bacteriohemerythrin [Desulfobulbaceae bacterium]
MSVVEWREEFRVGVQEIDGQHRQLFAVLARLDRAAEEEQHAGLDPILDELVRYLKEHFSAEERLLHTHPRWPEHHRLHWQFTEKTLHFLREWQRADGPEERSRLIAEIRYFLCPWLKDHILKTDRQYFSQPAIGAV